MKTIFTILFIFASFICSAQKLSENTPGQLKGMAKNALMYEDPYSAIEYYEAFLKKKKDNAEVMFSLAECYRNTRNYEPALKWYEKAFKTDPNKFAVAQYYWATMLMTQKDYDEAYNQLKDFSKLTKEDKSLKSYSKLASAQMKGCKFAQRNEFSVVWMDRVSNSINMPSVELSPLMLNKNTMLFSSLRTDTTVYTITLDEPEKLPVRQFYTGTRDSTNWKFKSEWDETPFNDKNLNTGNGAFSPDGKRFYFTRCQKNWKNKMICTILQSTKNESGTWDEPVALPEIINNPKYTATQPAVARYSKQDDEILYFVSDRPDGKGGYDIWYSRYKKKQKVWQEPKNCGSKINTEGNEVTPFVDMENSTMYFSSDAAGGLGQLDIYKSVGELGTWLPIENIKAPINSPFDDLYYSIGKDLTEGFYVSNRPGGNTNQHATCCDDLYTFKYDEIIKITATGSIYARVDRKYKILFETGDTVDGQTARIDSSFQLAAGTPVTLFIIDETAPFGGGNMIFVKSDSLDANGRFSFNLEAGREYVIDVENYGYFNQKYNLSTILFTQSDTMLLDTVGIDKMPNDAIVVNNLYYESGKADLTKAARNAIDKTLLKMLNDNLQIVIEVSSHTDNKGSDKANVLLSQKRAEGVCKYLIKKGIDKDRLYPRGYGEDRPIASNETEKGKDNPEGRKLNRRTEFKIIGSLDQYTEFNFK